MSTLVSGNMLRISPCLIDSISSYYWQCHDNLHRYTVRMSSNQGRIVCVDEESVNGMYTDIQWPLVYPWYQFLIEKLSLTYI